MQYKEFMFRLGPGLFFNPSAVPFQALSFFSTYFNCSPNYNCHKINLFFKNDLKKPPQPLNKIVKTFDLTLSKLNTLNFNAQIHKAGSFQNLKNSENS